MLESGRFLYKQVDSFPKIINSVPVARHCKLVSQPKGNVPKSSENVIIPQRIERGPTDILKALASTVKEDFTAFEYKYPDDPFFYSYAPFHKKVLSLALESGRKSAKWIVENNPAFFKHQLSEPLIKDFLPKTLDNAKLEMTEKTLMSAIEQRNTLEAIKIFRALQKENLEISEHTKQCLLELVCFYNCEPKPKEELESKWFSNPGFSVEHMNTWKNKEFAEELFSQMDSNCSLANSAIIQGLFKYNEIFKACELFEKAKVNKIKLSVGAYNAYLSNSHVLSGKEPMLAFLKKVLYDMSQRKIMPNLGTLNAILKSLEQSNAFQNKPIVAMQVLGEFENLDIKPSLGSYGIFFSIVEKSRDSEKLYFQIIKDIMNFIANREHEILHPSDLNFFLNSMTLFYRKKSNLIMTLHEMLLRNNNSKFITTSFDQNAYYQKLYCYVFRKKPVDFAMRIYRQHFNAVPPSIGTLKVILQAIGQSSSSEYFLEICEDLKKVHVDKSRAVMRQIINYLENCTDEPSLNVVYQATINFLEKSTTEDILIEDKKSISCILMALTKKDDEKRLLSVLQKFKENLQSLHVDDAVWKIIFDYAIDKKNNNLIQNVLTLASEAKHPDFDKMTKKAQSVLNIQDVAWTREF